ncbi:MAG: DUF4349 domain-containing protein [Herbinix sp.]|nr:DUF4349 domain-containing protein [Herbinix sp.]
MKRSKVWQIVGLLLIMVFIVTACGKKYSYSESTMDTAAIAESSNGTSGSAQINMEKDDSATGAKAPKDGEEVGLDNTATLTSSSLQAQSQDKIITCYYLDVETQDFDNLITELDTRISNLGGYVESSQINGKSIYDSNVTRRGNIVARVPSEKAGEFLSTVNEEANVVNNEKTSDNVSLEYIDAQSRIDTLKIEQERLFAILEKADNLENIITLESRLSEIRYELQNYESQLRSYDNKVEYSTITLNIQEVTRITPVTEVKPTFTSRIKTGFSDTIYNISEGFKNFVVWFIVNLPYLLIWGLIIFIVVIIVRRYLKKRHMIK